MKTLRKRLITLVILLSAGSWSALVEAGLITLDFTTLPSSQGWSYVTAAGGSHAGTPESSVFSVSANTLTGNTMGDGLASPSDLRYEQQNVVDPSLPWTLSWTMRVLNYETGSPLINDFGTWISVHNGESHVAMGLSRAVANIPTDGITMSGTSHTPLDT